MWQPEWQSDFFPSFLAPHPKVLNENFQPNLAEPRLKLAGALAKVCTSPAIYLSPGILFQYYELTSSRGAGNPERVESLTHCCARNCSCFPCKARWLGGPSPDALFPGQPATGGLS